MRGLLRGKLFPSRDNNVDVIIMKRRDHFGKNSKQTVVARLRVHSRPEFFIGPLPVDPSQLKKRVVIFEGLPEGVEGFLGQRGSGITRWRRRHLPVQGGNSKQQAAEEQMKYPGVHGKQM